MTRIRWSSFVFALLPLFQQFPSLEKRIPRVELIQEIAPLEPMRNFEKAIYEEQGIPLPDSPSVWVKRDDRSWTMLGGNKARKLEFILGAARDKESRTLVTVGMYGSNHALSTAEVGKEFGYKVKLILGPQPVTENVRQKLLAFHALGAEIRYHSNVAGMAVDIAKALVQQTWPGEHLYYVTEGGSSTVGDVGYANAFLELVAQTGIDGLPERIVLPVGTRGTAAGLLAGMCLAHAWEKTQIVGVQVAQPEMANETLLRLDARATFNYLRSLMSADDRARVSECDFLKSKKAFRMERRYYAPAYGAATPHVFEAIGFARKTEQLELDGTYSGKAMTFLLDSVREAVARHERVPKTVFWATYNAYDLDQIIRAYPWKNPAEKWRELPKEFWHLFTESLPSQKP